MIDPTSDHHTDDTNDALKHFTWGLVPAAASGLALLIQGLTGAVPATHTGILYVLTTAGVVTSATTLLWCTSTRIKTSFEKRHDAQEAILTENRRILVRLDRSLQALHRKLDHAEADRQSIRDDVDHLRRLMIEDTSTPVNGQRLGPRSLS